MKINLKFVLCVSLALLIVGCNLQAEVTDAPQSPSLEAAPTATSPPPTATPEPELIHFQVAPGVEQLSIPALSDELERLAHESGYLFNQASMDEAVPQEASILVTMADPDSIRAWRVERPDLHIVALGVEGLEPNEGITIIGPEGFRLDRVSFMAGYLGAMLIPDHRIGMIYSQDQPDRDTWQSAFLAGQGYYCGLCRTVYPPFEDYPIFLSLPEDFGGDQANDQLGILRQRSVNAVFLAPGISLSSLAPALSGSEFMLFSAVEPATSLEGLAAVIRPAPEINIIELWPSILAGEGPAMVDIQIIIDRKDPDAISDARLDVAQQVLADLNSGFITTLSKVD